MTAWGGDSAALAVLRIAMAASADEATRLDFAACVEVDPALFFAERGEPAGPAKRVCATCPVRAQCIEYALDGHTMHGIFGGTSRHERRDLLRQRRTAA